MLPTCDGQWWERCGGARLRIAMQGFRGTRDTPLVNAGGIWSAPWRFWKLLAMGAIALATPEGSCWPPSNQRQKCSPLIFASVPQPVRPGAQKGYGYLTDGLISACPRYRIVFAFLSCSPAGCQRCGEAPASFAFQAASSSISFPLPPSSRFRVRLRTRLSIQAELQSPFVCQTESS